MIRKPFPAEQQRRVKSPGNFAEASVDHTNLIFPAALHEAPPQRSAARANRSPLSGTWKAW